MIKAAQLAQQTSRSHFSKVTATRNKLRDTQDELHREKAHGSLLRHENARLKHENKMLLARVAALEANHAQLTDCRQSLSQFIFKERSVMRHVGLY